MKFSVRLSGLGVFVLSALVGYFFISSNENTQVYQASSNAVVKKIQLANYCMALRGNGELEPAHWGGLAQTIEQLGLPQAMAGGSSASISMFWLNAIAQNPLLHLDSISSEENNLRASLMVKSFLGFFNELKNTKFSQDFFKLYGIYNQAQAQAMTLEMKAALIKKNYPLVESVLKTGIKLGLFDSNSLIALFNSIQKKDEARTKFYLDELSDSVRLFGKFDATTDANLFFRAGLVSFENASESFGRLAAFYAAESIDDSLKIKWSQFFESCTLESKGLSWVGLMQKKPECGMHFHQIFEAYFQKEPELHFEDRDIGEPISVFPTTSVLVGEAVREVEKAFTDYDLKMSPQFGLNFRPKNPEEVRFGYWGNESELQVVQNNLDLSDEKNRRFFSLGRTTWKQVLSLSPAEPGLSPVKKFNSGSQTYISAGGWSDLHPVDVLKASGCENVVYITREGGESFFAQGIANRLMNLGRDLKKLQNTTKEQKEKNAKLNNFGDAAANPNSVWSKLFNMASPLSSINRALVHADAVLCTNWNNYDVKKDLPGLIENAYRSHYAINPKSGEVAAALQPRLNEVKPGCAPMNP